MAKLLKDDAGVPIPQLMLDDGNFVPAKGTASGAMRVTGEAPVGDVGGAPVKIGGVVLDTTAPPPPVEAGRIAAAACDNRGRLLIKMDTAPPLPTGAATSAKQDEIRARIDAAVNVLGTLATAAKQDTIAAAVAAIKDDVAAIRALLTPQSPVETALIARTTITDNVMSADVAPPLGRRRGRVFVYVYALGDASSVAVTVNEVYSFGTYAFIQNAPAAVGTMQLDIHDLTGVPLRVDVTVTGTADVAVYFVAW